MTRKEPIADRQIEVKGSRSIELGPGEQVTLRTESGTGYDVVRTSWGFYAASSLNSRLPKEGFRPALIRDAEGRGHVVLVLQRREREFFDHLIEARCRFVTWLDHEAGLAMLAEAQR